MLTTNLTNLESENIHEFIDEVLNALDKVKKLQKELDAKAAELEAPGVSLIPVSLGLQAGFATNQAVAGLSQASAFLEQASTCLEGVVSGAVEHVSYSKKLQDKVRDII